MISFEFRKSIEYGAAHLHNTIYRDWTGYSLGWMTIKDPTAARGQSGTTGPSEQIKRHCSDRGINLYRQLTPVKLGQ